MFSILQNVNKPLGVMADWILNTNQSIKRFYPSNTDDQLDPKRWKHMMMVQTKMEMTGTRDFRSLALKPTKLPKLTHVLDSSDATAAMTQCCRKSKKIFNAFHFHGSSTYFMLFHHLVWYDNKSPPEDSSGESNRDPVCAEKTSPTVVTQANADANQESVQLPRGRDTVPTQQPRGTPPTSQETMSDSKEIPLCQRPFDDSYHSHGTILDVRFEKTICYLPSEVEVLLQV